MSQKDEIQKYYKWYEKTYSDIIGLDKLKKYAIDNSIGWLIKACDNFIYLYSSIWRFETMSNLKFLSIPMKTEYIFTIFKISRPTDDINYTTSYAIMYSIYNEKEIDHQYVSISPTYKSADGEYRHRFIPVKQLLDHKTKYSNLYDDVESMILEQANNGDVSFQTNTFYPKYIKTKNDYNKIVKKFDTSIDRNRFVPIFYAAVWFLEFNRFIRKRSENHIADGFHAAMFDYFPQQVGGKHNSDEKRDENSYDLDIWNKHKDFLDTPTEAGDFYHMLFNIIPNPNQKTLVSECGQKLIPMTIYDVEAIQDIRLPPWREMYITSLASDLVINGITPGIPIMNDWFFIQSTNKDMFDNKINHMKIDHSIIAMDIVHQLESSRKNTYVIDPINKDEIFISYNMEGLSQAIDIPMDYAEHVIIMSNYTLCSLEEHLGRTVADIPHLMMYESYQRPMGPMFKDYRFFAKYMFEFIYNLWCLNSKLGVIHGDLHLNNATIFHKTSTIAMDTGKIKVNDPYKIIGVGDNWYIFPHRGRHSALIDFSRAFIWNPNLDKDFEPHQITNIKNNHKLRIIQTLERDLPDFTSSRKALIELALERDFDSVYCVFKAIDVYKFMKGMSILIERDILNNKKHLKAYADKTVLEKQILPLLTNLVNAAYDFITKHIELIINNNPNQSLQIPEPNLLFFRFFEEFKITNFQTPVVDIGLIDIFRDQNELKYNVRNYDNFPPMVRFDYIQEHNLDMDKLHQERFVEMEQYFQEHPPQQSIDQIRDETIESKAERRGTPVSEPVNIDVINELKVKTDTSYFS